MIYIRHRSRNFWIPILSLCAGLIFCSIALVSYLDIRASLQQRPAMAQGRIISCHMENVQEGETQFGNECRPTVRFQTPSGQQIMFVSSYTWAGFYQGDNVSVQYTPDPVRDAVIVSRALWVKVWMAGAFLGLPSIIFGIGWGYWSLRKRSQRNHLRPGTPPLS